MDKILVYRSNEDNLTVLEASGENAVLEFENNGSAVDDWGSEEDNKLGCPPKGHGLFVWEGSIEDDGTFKGKYRALDDSELTALQRNEPIFGAPAAKSSGEEPEDPEA